MKMACEYCEFRCDLESGKSVCGRYVLNGKEIVEKEPYRFVQPYFFEMESLPFFHVEPGKSAVQLGTKSCNAACDYCINAHLTVKDNDDELTYYTPGEIACLAKDRASTAVTFGINEITVFWPSAKEIAKVSREAGMLTGCLTNGFMTEETTRDMAGHLDMVNISLKSMSDRFYRESLNLPSAGPVLRNIRAFSKKVHVELITPVTQENGLNELHDMIDFIEDIDPDIPWNLFHLYRTHKRINDRGRDFREIIDFVEAARKRLPFTYFSNFPGSRWVDTICPECSHHVVRRISIGACGAQHMKSDLTPEDACPECGRKIPILRNNKRGV